MDPPTTSYSAWSRILGIFRLERPDAAKRQLEALIIHHRLHQAWKVGDDLLQTSCRIVTRLRSSFEAE